MNKQVNLDKAAKNISCNAQPGRQEQSGQKFSPLSIPQSPEGQATKTSSETYSVSIGRPMDDSRYDRLKKAAETETSGRSAVEGQQDEAACL